VSGQRRAQVRVWAQGRLSSGPPGRARECRLDARKGDRAGSARVVAADGPRGRHCHRLLSHPRCTDTLQQTVHAVEDGRYVAVCGAEVVWPFQDKRPHWLPRSSYACRDFDSLLKVREASSALQPDIGSPRVEHAG
jgi:hypothetical protein